MKRWKLTALLMAMVVLLSACTNQPTGNTNATQNNSQIEQNTPDDTNNEVPPNPDSSADDKQDEVACPTDITVELVIEWEIADAILSALDDLSEQLRQAVEEAGCQLDSVTLTISTAGAYTADSLREGGVDAAILPSVDIIPYENQVAVLALSAEEIPQTAIAVSLIHSDMTEAFRESLFYALTQTETGQAFLSAFCGETEFSTPTEAALQAVRDYLQEWEESGRAD